MEKSKVLLTIAATVILSTNFTFADQGSLESNEYNKGEVKIITQEDIKQNCKRL